MSDYVQPVGEADPNAPYKDRNTGAGEPGSKVPALAIEMPQREIRTVIVSAGLTPDRTDGTQLNEAIDKKIALATSGGENPLDDLLALLRSRLRTFPEILTSDGRFNLSSPATGTVRIPSGIEILHRGVFITTTVQQDFTTAANKVYHLRYRWTGGSPGWELVDTSNSGYNPSALAESDPTFDTSYDDMLTHRVTTDASNVATIVSLANKDRLYFSGIVTGTDVRLSGLNGANYLLTCVLAWARTPKLKDVSLAFVNNVGATDLDMNIMATSGLDRNSASAVSAATTVTPVSRNGLSAVIMVDQSDAVSVNFSAGA